ncbi:MAG: DsbA family protein [Myxococcaceae bacterium]
MHSFSFRLSLLSMSALSVLACANAKGPGQSSASSAGGSSNWKPDTIVATYEGGKITAADVDAKASAQIMTARRDAANELLNETLIKNEAQKRGISEEALVKAEVDDKLTAPPEEQMKGMYDQAKAAGQIPAAATYEQVRPRIIQFMQQGGRQKRMSEFLAGLQTQAKARVIFRVPVAATGPAKGPESAKVTLVEFSDFECPFCSRAKDTVDQVMAAYPGKVRLVFRQFPLRRIHPNAAKAAEAALCANEQGKFWEYHDVLFANQKALDMASLKQHATTVGLEAGAFGGCLDSGKFAKQVETDEKEGAALGVQGTPAFFVNGVALTGAVPLEDFKRQIDAELASN